MISINELLILLRYLKGNRTSELNERSRRAFSNSTSSHEKKGEIYKVPPCAQSLFWHFNTLGMTINIKVAITNEADCSDIEILC